ncbi:hypothetical protein HRbin17_01645 [bacterium HR17]|uniref:Uncharacterized protein n=1 Tax=Candidatus Fervidibacter japonicus TaxID=2035412 RepID=A0A2H5XD77_9BACT|nr:hypothetical protein HRbin17_01645 [bacterium HR17]
MPKPRDFDELRRMLAEQGEEDLAESILPLSELAPPDLLEQVPALKNLALVAITELTDGELEDMAADWDGEGGEEGEPPNPVEMRRVMGLPNLIEKASMCDLMPLEGLLEWLRANGVRFEG